MLIIFTSPVYPYLPTALFHEEVLNERADRTAPRLLSSIKAERTNSVGGRQSWVLVENSSPDYNCAISHSSSTGDFSTLDVVLTDFASRYLISQPSIFHLDLAGISQRMNIIHTV